MVALKKFQFPSNGKAYHKRKPEIREWYGRVVSIPFKRESVSQAEYGMIVATLDKFQFPSNGKAYHKLTLEVGKSKGATISFNSLQTGKRITSYGEKQIGKTFYVSIPFKRESVSQEI